ncbi:MAG: NAD(P)H-dependent oxidoreductase [Lachnospiraceae bacterium]|nr:NAD(P)H-dependent oxidoreductase [Lachnospiraceae bacterium]
MKILVINGSPSGDDSITLQTVLYIKKYYPKHKYEFINAGRMIRSFEKDFSGSEKLLKEADLILFCYPVYTFLVPSQLHRFIELIKEKGIDLSGKYAAQITTSKHFYDTTSHEFIKENCFDLRLKYVGGLSADMEDLLNKRGRHDALSFFHHVLWSVKFGVYEEGGRVEDRERLIPAKFDIEDRPKKKGKKVVIVTDCAKEDKDLRNMTERFRKIFGYETKTVDLNEFPFAGGCLGCFNCASSGKCIYKDGFDSFLREKIQTADATVYAFKIKDHSMGSLFKTFDDRQFCNGHRTVTMGKPVGYIINGHLSSEPNLKTLIEARAQVGNNYLVHIASNEHDTDAQIDMLASEMEYALSEHYVQPANFYGVGGLKIFRDLIYTMQGLMREDHRFNKKHGFYDFPQKNIGRILGMYAVGMLINNKKIAKKIGSNMTQGMLMPYKKIIETK